MTELPNAAFFLTHYEPLKAACWEDHVEVWPLDVPPRPRVRFFASSHAYEVLCANCTQCVAETVFCSLYAAYFHRCEALPG